jgi:translation initiation factor IF-2
MKKIRINVLARELEVKSHLILELLPEMGVSEKLTHSSSIDEDVADKLRVRFGLEPIGNGEGHSGGQWPRSRGRCRGAARDGGGRALGCSGG